MHSTPLVLTSRIPADARGRSLLAYLVDRFRYRDDRGWREELASGRLTLDGATADGSELLRPGMRLRYERQHREPPVDRRYRVLHRDDAIVVVDKPAHLPMHADGPFIRSTLIHLLRTELGLDGLQLVHRLDRETSGVCLCAVGKAVQATLQAQFVAGGVQKCYAAVVHGLVLEPFVVELPIGHAAGSEIRLRRSATPDAIAPQTARTRFEPLQHGRDRTLLRCMPETGRTHQIRVHLEAAGHPVVGDKLYGRPDASYLDFVHRMKAGASVFDSGGDGPNRHLLHAHSIAFRHPSTGETVRFEAPLPEAFTRLL